MHFSDGQFFCDDSAYLLSQYLSIPSHFMNQVPNQQLVQLGKVCCMTWISNWPACTPVVSTADPLTIYMKVFILKIQAEKVKASHVT